MINNKTNARETMAFLDCHTVMAVFWHVYHEARRKSRKCGFYKGTTTKKSTDTKCLQKAARLNLRQMLNTPRLLSQRKENPKRQQ